MVLEELDCTKNYSFSGVFWFGGEFKNRFSGTLEFTPEKGIRLSLVSTSLNGECLLMDGTCSIQKMYGTIQYKATSINITLLDVLLQERSRSFGNEITSFYEGTSKMLILNVHLKFHKVKAFNVAYEDNFRSIFFFHSPSIDIPEIEPYIGKSLNASNARISFDIFYSITPFYDADQLDNMLCDTLHRKKNSSIKELKKILIPFLKKHSHEIGIRKDPCLVVKIKGKSSNFNDYLKIENRFRSFFELLVYSSIQRKKMWFEIESISKNGTKQMEQKAVLIQQYPIPKHNTLSWHKLYMPITIDDFIGENDLSRIQNPYNIWNLMQDDKKWEMVLSGVKNIIYNRDLIKNEDFVILITYIETVLDLLGHKKNNLDECIQCYASESWKKEVTNLLKQLPKGTSLGDKISQLRNSIVHPKSAEKKEGKYFKVIINMILMQKVYAYTSGLLVKMILLHLHSFDKNRLEKYVERFIQLRSGFYEVKYEKDYATYRTKLDKKAKRLQKKKL